MARDEAKIKFTAETKEFNDQIKTAESSLKELRSELKLNSSQMKKTGDNTKTLQERQKILTKELATQRSKTDALAQKLEKAKQIYGENSEQVKKYQTQLNNAKAVEEKIQAEISDTTEQLKKQKTAFDEVADKAEKAGDKLTKAGKAMSAVSAGIVAVGTASVAAFNEVDVGADNAIKATGATGDAAEEMEEAYKNVASGIVGDFGDIGSALGEVNTRFGFTGSELEEATTKFQKFSEVTGMDATTAVQKVSRYMGDAGIDSSEYASVLDDLTVAAQASGVKMETLTENLTKYGAPMRALGFETQESIAIFSSWEKAGVNTEIAFSGMKKAIGTWSKEGKDSRKEFKKTLTEIKNCPDIASATTKAIEVFGQKAGPDLADAIQNGRFEYEDMLAVIEGSDGALEGTFDETVDGGYELELAMQNAKLALAEVGDTLSSTLAPIVESVTDGLKQFAEWWKGLNSETQQSIIKVAGVVAAIGPLLIIFGKVASGISALSKTFKAAKGAITVVKTAMSGLNLTFLASPITWIIAAIVALIAIFVVLWNKCDWFREFWINLWNSIKKACGTAWKCITDKVSKAWEAIKNAWSGVKQWFGNVWNGIKNVFSNVKSWFSEKFNSAKQGVQNAWSGVKGFFTKAKNGIVNAFSNIKEKLSAPFERARDKIRGVVDKIKGFFSGLKLKLPKIKLPHFKVTGKLSLNPPSVPKLSIDWYKDGGIFTKPTIFNTPYGLKGFGEAGAEAVLPIDNIEGYVASAIERHAPSIDLQVLADAIEDLANRPIAIGINGRQFAQATAGDTDSVNGLRSRFKSRGLVLD